VGDHFDPSFRPDLPPDVILNEHAWLQGAFLGAVAYGILVPLYAVTFSILWKQRNQANRTQNLIFIGYTSIIFIMSTLCTGGMLQFAQESFIDGRNIEGGPSAFENVMFSLPVDMLVNAMMLMTSWFCDIINVWRCYVVYKGCRVNSWLVNLVPILMYIASIPLGILLLKQVGTPAQSVFVTSGINYTIPYYALSLSLNIFVTLLIVLRLVVYRWRIVKAMGPGHGSQYTSLAAMIVESAFLYSAFALLFLVPFALNSPITPIFMQGISLVQAVSTMLIIFRVATGKGWSHEAYQSAMTATIHRTPLGGSTVRGAGSTTAFSSNSGGRPIMLGKIPSSSDDFHTHSKDSTNGVAMQVLVEKSAV